MNSSKFLFSTLIAAAAMTATAHAESITYDDYSDSLKNGLQWTASFGDATEEETNIQVSGSFTVAGGVGTSASSAVYWGASGADASNDVFSDAFTFSFDLSSLSASNWTNALTFYTGGSFVQIQKSNTSELMVYPSSADGFSLGGLDSLMGGGTLTFVFENQTLSGYVDGTLVNSVALGDVALTGFSFGGDKWKASGYERNATVTVDNVAVWNRALTGDEVSALIYVPGDYVWGGASSGVWSEALWTKGNDTGQALGSKDNVTFNSSVTMTATEDVTVRSVVVAEGATLTLDGTGTVTASSLSGSIHLNQSATLAGISGSDNSGSGTTDASNVTGSGTIEFQGVGQIVASPGNGVYSNLKLSDSFTGTLAITSGLVNVLSVNTDTDLGGTTKILLNGGGLLFKNGAVDGAEAYYGTETFEKDIEIGSNGGVIRLYGANAGTTLSGNITGGVLTHTDGGVLIIQPGEGKSVNLTGLTQAAGGTYDTISGKTVINGNVTIGNATVTAGTLELGAGATVTNATVTAGILKLGSDVTVTTVTLGNGTVDLTAPTTVTSVVMGNGSGVQTTTVKGALTVSENLTQTGVDNGEKLIVSEGSSITVNGYAFTNNSSYNGLSQSVITLEDGASFSAGSITHTDGLTVNLGNNSKVSTGEMTLNATWGGDKVHSLIAEDGVSGAIVEVDGIKVGTNKSSETDSTTLNVTNVCLNVGTSGITSFGSGTASRKMVLTNATLGVRDSATSWSSDVAMALNSTNTADVDSKKSITLGGVISGSGSLVKTGNGALTLSNSNSYTGGTTISAGTLVAANASALGTGAVTVEKDATLTFATTVSGVTGGVEINEGATFAIDLTNFTQPVSEGDEVGFTILTNTALTFNGAGANTLSSGDIDSCFDVEGSTLGAYSEWAREWAYNTNTNTLSLTLTIPEPSAFGLLAGVGALALVVSRRRRNRR